MIALDTTVISELIRPSPNYRIVRWTDDQEQDRLFITLITVAELLYGIERLSDGRRKQELSKRFGDMFTERFRTRILAFNQDAAASYAVVATRRERIGRRMETADAQIAAICLTHQATLATRNIRGFEETGITLINPWDD